LDTAGRLIANGAARSVTVTSPPARRARIARRVGSASAASVALSWSAAMYFTTLLINQGGEVSAKRPLSALRILD
jgi:hypothetical protein